MKTVGTYLFVAILLSASLLAACGQAASPSAPAVATLASANPISTEANPVPLGAGNCTVLSKAEVGNVLAQDVEEVREEGKGTLCVYQTKSLIFELVFVHPGGMSLDQYMETVRTTNGDPALIPGLGDEAFYNTNPAYRILFVRKGDAAYSFGVRSDTPDQGPSPEDVQVMEKALAEQMLNNLP